MSVRIIGAAALAVLVPNAAPRAAALSYGSTSATFSSSTGLRKRPAAAVAERRREPEAADEAQSEGNSWGATFQAAGSIASAGAGIFTSIVGAGAEAARSVADRVAAAAAGDGKRDSLLEEKSFVDFTARSPAADSGRGGGGSASPRAGRGLGAPAPGGGTVDTDR